MVVIVHILWRKPEEARLENQVRTIKIVGNTGGLVAEDKAKGEQTGKCIWSHYERPRGPLT
jgi:hypothetical protein